MKAKEIIDRWWDETGRPRALDSAAFAVIDCCNASNDWLEFEKIYRQVFNMKYLTQEMQMLVWKAHMEGLKRAAQHLTGKRLFDPVQ